MYPSDVAMLALSRRQFDLFGTQLCEVWIDCTVNLGVGNTLWQYGIRPMSTLPAGVREKKEPGSPIFSASNGLSHGLAYLQCKTLRLLQAARKGKVEEGGLPGKWSTWKACHNLGPGNL